MSKHTEGPWTVAGRFIVALKQKVVCEIPRGGVRRGKVDDANANLIAAAPTMYKALQKIFDKEGWSWLIPILAKAEGRKGS